MIIGVLVEITNKSVDRIFDYLVPKSLEDKIEVGKRVRVPFGNRTLVGFILEKDKNSGVDKLKEIEEKENVTILMAVESGSRAWGFASPDSDYDVRFIYVRKKEDYLRLDTVRDVIDWQLDDVLDINGWDVKKALQLMHNSNPTIFEWCESPIVYRTSEAFEQMKQLRKEYFSPKKSLYHYLHMAESNYRKFLQCDQIKVKKYFYVLRPILAAKWIAEKKIWPPMLFSELMEAELEEDLKPETERLLVMKKEMDEMELVPGSRKINAYVESNLEKFKKLADDMPKTETSWDSLNHYFQSLLS